MGQRHQLFIRTLNPLKIKSFSSPPRWEDKELAAKGLGRQKTTVLAFHHQWLFGQSAVRMALHLLNITNPETAKMYGNPFHPETGPSVNVGYGSEDSYRGWVNAVKMMAQCITDPKFPRGIGIERLLYLNDNEPEMRTDCTLGDNNDGITIIDAIERKYCFMNIYEEDYCESVSKLPQLVPATARQYAAAYYPEDVDDFSDYTKEGKTDEELAEQAKKHAENNDWICRELDSFELLTVEELAKIFPKVFKGATV